MRKNIVAGNWKMNKTLQEGIATASEIDSMLAGKNLNCEVVIATPFIHLALLSNLLKDSKIEISAENCANKSSGAYTGEVSAEMIASTGATYCIIGHSERRAYYLENNETLREKVLLALENNLTPIFCVGETKDERQNDQQNMAVERQLNEALFGLSPKDFGKIVVAYEPVWAIGTGLTATSDQAQEMHRYIRSLIEKRYDSNVAQNTTILYGGSCNPSNAKELFSKPDVDGGLIGGASLKAEEFVKIVESF